MSKEKTFKLIKESNLKYYKIDIRKTVYSTDYVKASCEDEAREVANDRISTSDDEASLHDLTEINYDEYYDAGFD